ncbi:ARM repeat superfamily protein isoform 1 [Dorcoceras hygrometricum]|uniref:ARM repeat superfamily protein isoform 1 n=1 Tax=Dorcoceras hygrometricum TaxID=472368 RepID=A0A2Z6ZSD3_9LAMI|nr:ARM repeat superfamily protein isoform 1 [Dorcoceras hygrometricum]
MHFSLKQVDQFRKLQFSSKQDDQLKASRFNSEQAVQLRASSFCLEQVEKIRGTWDISDWSFEIRTMLREGIRLEKIQIGASYREQLAVDYGRNSLE